MTTDRESGKRATGGSVATRFTIAVSSLVLLCMCVVWLIRNYTNQNLLRQQADSLGAPVARQTAIQVAALVLANDLITTRVMLEQLTREAAIAEAAVINVNGEDAAPIYKYLTGKDTKPAGKGDISWNFEKFLIDREGNLINRFEPRTKPSDEELVKAVESELSK